MLYTCTEVSRGGEWGRRRRCVWACRGRGVFGWLYCKALVCMRHESCIMHQEVRKACMDVWMYVRKMPPTSELHHYVCSYVCTVPTKYNPIRHSSTPTCSFQPCPRWQKPGIVGTASTCRHRTKPPPKSSSRACVTPKRASQGLTSSTTQVFRAGLSRNIMYCVTQYVHVQIYMYIVIHSICNST